MYQKTKFKYRFKYLKTGVSGPGIHTVYLPDPEDYEILYTKEDKFVRTAYPKQWNNWLKEERKRQKTDPEYMHPEVTEFINREWERRINGIYFMNKGVLTYMNGVHYWAINWLRFKFGYMDYRETDKELYYFLQFCKEDPMSYGTVFITIRRWGKSTAMAASALEPATRLNDFFVGMQGENDVKIASFYRTNILQTFNRLAPFWRPVTNDASTHVKKLDLSKTYKRGKNDYNDDYDALDSWIDYRPSGDFAYDGEKLHYYEMEEAGKIEKHDVRERWDVVKPCLRDGIDIIGKAFLASTVDNMDIAEKGGNAFQELYFDSDVDKRGPDGKTVSGLYACYLTGDCALIGKGMMDDWGHPIRKAQREHILLERKSNENKSASKKAGWIRKYFLTLSEAFWVENNLCPFNVNILNKRYEELLGMNNVDRGKLKWKNNVRFSQVYWELDENGPFAASWLPTNPEELNLVEPFGEEVNAAGELVTQYRPLNDKRFAMGADTIQNRIDPDSKKKSKPVTLAKTKYDPEIDGYLNEDLLCQRRDEKYQYKTNRYFMMYDRRPQEPTIYYEDMVKMCWFLGCMLHIENQKGAIIDWFYTAGMRQFVMSKFIGESEVQSKLDAFMPAGTHANAWTIESYTNYLATYIEYFGHTIPFITQVDDHRKFNPNKPTKHDHTVSAGFTELACVNKRVYENKPLDIEDIFFTFTKNP